MSKTVFLTLYSDHSIFLGSRFCPPSNFWLHEQVRGKDKEELAKEAREQLLAAVKAKQPPPDPLTEEKREAREALRRAVTRSSPAPQPSLFQFSDFSRFFDEIL